MFSKNQYWYLEYIPHTLLIIILIRHNYLSKEEATVLLL